MVTTRLNLRRTARILSNRGGFTLVELLVVIGIIAILAGVALGPITNGIKKAKQSAGVQEAHALGLAMYSAANDNSQLYPDSTSNQADDIAAALLAGGYVSDPSIFHLSGDTVATKITTTNNSATTIKGTGVTCWDFLGNSGNGVNSTTYPYLPLLWSTLTRGTLPNLGTVGPAAITAIPIAANPFSTDGIAIFYINNSAAFATMGLVGNTLEVTMVTTANNLTATAPNPPLTINAGK